MCGFVVSAWRATFSAARFAVILPRCVLRVCVVLLALLVLRVPLVVLVPVLLVGGWGCESEGVPNREVEFRVASLRFALRDVS